MDSTYHHGSLREALLADGRRLLVRDGIEGVTLRELARRAGVSHAAPRRHFADRDALLAALAERGFDELTAALDEAAQHPDVDSRLRSYGRASVRFAVENGALHSLMFGSKRTSSPSAQRFFARGATLLGAPASAGATPDALTYLVAATFEGIASLAVAERLPAARIDEVVDTAVEALLPLVERSLAR